MYVEPVLFFYLIALLPLGFGIWQFWKERTPRRWPQVPGTVVSSTIDKRATSRGYYYVPKIEYEFCYDEQTFKSSRRRASNYASGQSVDAKDIAAHYPVGGSVRVFVNPRKPTESVLEHGTTPLSWIPFVIGLLWLALSIFASIKGQ
jgi:hypothetical protein